MFERFYTIFNLFCINYLSHISFQLNKGEERGLSLPLQYQEARVGGGRGGRERGEALTLN